MDSSLATLVGARRAAAVAGETSRCSRCVRDKKGCDRRYPCSRCVESGLTHLCVYTGSISQSRPGRRYLSDVEDEGGSGLSTPGSTRRRRRPRQSGTPVNGRARGLARKRHSMEVDRVAVDEHWYNEPPPPREVELVDPEPERSEEELLRYKILGEFTDIVTHLPIEIYRSTTFIRSLDRSYLDKTRMLDDCCRELQHSTDLKNTVRLRSRIASLMRQSRQDRAETVAEVAKLQGLVESHITLLSADIDKVENPQSAVPVIQEDSKQSSPQQTKRRKKGAAAAAEGASDGFDIPIDDGEPVYCTCQRVSFGKMIACENEACEGGEWFHFACLGITATPRGKWWCAVCTEAGLASRRAVPGKGLSEELDEGASRATTVANGRRSRKGAKVRGETMTERRARIREENRVREANRRLKLKNRRRPR